MANSDGQVRIQIEDNIQEAQNRLNTYEKQVNNFDVSGLQGGIDVLNRTINGLSSQFADFVKPVQQDDSALKELENTVKAQKTVIEELKQSCNGLTAELNNLKKPVEENTKKFDDLGKSYNTALVAQEKLFSALHVDKSFHDTSSAVNEAVQRMKELAFQGDTTSREFKNLSQFVNEANKKIEETNKAVNQATGGLAKQSSGMAGLTSIATKFIGGYVGIQGAMKAFQFSMESVNAYRVQERAIKSLDTTLKNAGVYTAEYSANIQKLASEIQGYSNYGDEAVIKAQALGQSFAGQVPFTENATKAVVDFAAATGMDLEQAFTLVGKSVGSNTNALARYGVQLEKGMTDSQKMEAITKQLGDRYKGQAAQMADAGTQLKNSIGDMKESFGAILNGYVTNWQSGMNKMVNATTSFINQIRVMHAEVSSLSTADLEKRYNKNAQKIAQYAGAQTRGSYELLKREAALKAENNLILQQIKYIKEQQKVAQNVKPIKFTDETPITSSGIPAGTGSTGINTSTQTQQIKDDYEQLQEAVQKARREIELAAIAHGTSSQEVRNAFINYNQLNTQLSAISELFDVEKQKADETKGAYQQLQERIQTLKTELLNLGAEGGIGTAQFEQLKTEYLSSMEEIQNIDKSLTQEMGQNWDKVGENISHTLGSTLMSALQGGQNALQAFSNIATSLLQKVLDKMLEMAVITPILNALTGGSGGTLFSGIANFFGVKSANGNVFQNGNVIPFAKGGVVNKPTVFPMANGGTGLMGEAGAEAVMPLRRMSNGRLGVEAKSDNGKAVNVNIYNQSNSQVETRQRNDGGMDIIIKRVNEALMNERTSSGFRAAYQREDRKGLQAV